MANQAAEHAASFNLPPPVTCLHHRLIDDVLTTEGKRTGKVRCVECGAVFDDPEQGLE